MWCPGKGCNKACQSNTGRTVGVQCECQTNFCFTCQKATHRPLPCEMLEKWEKEVQRKQDNLNEAWIKGNAKLCPNCKVPIQKNEGCNHIKCAACQYMFCWLCMGGPAEHPGSSATHIAQCNSLADVENKGRMAEYEAGKVPVLTEDD